MRLPRLNPIQRSRQSVTVFGGYNHNPVIGDGEWWDMENMTSDHYPLLAPDMGGTAEKVPGEILGMVSNNGLCYVRQVSGAPEFIIKTDVRDVKVNVALEAGTKQLISMGAYVIILPDKKWVNTADHTHGAIDAEEIISGGAGNSILFQICTKDGIPIAFTASAERPENPEDGVYWIDVAKSPPVLKQWYESARIWMEQESYLRITVDGGQPRFQKGDAITAPAWSGSYGSDDIPGGKKKVFIQENPVIQEVIKHEDGKNYSYVVRGVAEYGTAVANSEATGSDPLVWERKMPDLDFVIESGNRLWGCKFGQTDDVFINEIYASKLGDFKNWNSFQGVSTDSYRASLGADGKFTGAITYNGKPIFFKEDCMTLVYGAYPAQYQVTTIDCNGVQDNCSGSLAVVNNRLYYLSKNGVCLYDGSLPVSISAQLGNLSCGWAGGGAAGDKYYLFTYGDQADAFVLDTRRGMWHKPRHLSGWMDYLRTAQHGGDLYTWYSIPQMTKDLPGVDMNTHLYRISGVSDSLGGDVVDVGNSWFVESGDIGLTTTDAKYISQLSVRMSLAEGSEVSFLVRYNFEDEWHYLTTITGTSLRTFDVPIRPKRCDTMRLRIEGRGDARIYAITKTFEQGGDAR